MFIEQPAFFLRWLYPSALWRMDSSQRAVYLTFDDGPIPIVTPWVLDVLDTYEAKATFFMVGDNVRKHPREFQMVVERGHGLGNHTYHHLAGHLHGVGSYLRDVEMAARVIPSRLFRPPRGWMKTRQYLALRHDYRIVMWDLVTRDYSTLLTGRDVLRNVKRYARPGSIITFHDSVKSYEKLQYALPRTLQWLRDEGYAFKLFDEVQHDRKL